MSTPNLNLSNLDSRYSTPAQVDTKVAAAAASVTENADGTFDVVATGGGGSGGSSSGLSASSVTTYFGLLRPESYGAVGDGSTDDTAAVQQALTAAAANATQAVLLTGYYKITSALTIADEVTVQGVGVNSGFNWTGTGSLFTFGGLRKRFSNFQIVLNTAGQTGVTLSNAFRCSFDRITIQGSHYSTTGSTYYTQTGLLLTNNAGDNWFKHCEFNNLGVGIETVTIQNYIVGCAVGGCYKGIHGGDPTGGAYVAGISVSDTTFVSTGPSVTAYHVQIEGGASTWWFSNVWMEGCATGIQIGNANGAPTDFNFHGGKVAATTKCLDFLNALSVTLMGVQLAGDGNATPTEVSFVNGFNGAGFVAGVKDGLGYDFSTTIWPSQWFVQLRDRVIMPAYMNAPNNAFFLQGDVTVDQSLRLNSTTLPAADNTQVGRIRYVAGGSGVADAAYMCLKQANGTYLWVSLT